LSPDRHHGAVRLPAFLIALALSCAASPVLAFRVVTFNVLHGGLDSGLRGDGQHLDLRLELAAAGLSALEADVVALQEASVGRARGSVAERLATKIGLRHVALASPADWLKRAAAVVLGFDEVPALTSRFPLERVRTRPIARCGEILPRSLVCADVAVPYGPITVCSTHLDGSACQLADLAAALRDEGGVAPLVLMGDLNTTDEAPGFRRLVESLGLIDAFRTIHPRVRGFTVWQPVTDSRPRARRRVDYVLVRPGAERTLAVDASRVVLDRPHRTRVGMLWPSDHHAVLADLRIVPRTLDAVGHCDRSAPSP
jgi:endonuclease/exonuclease/phosphatase family metal-dependent hydrolase